MTLSDLSIKRPVFAWMLFFGLLLFGLVSFARLGVSQLPDVDFPVVNVKLVLEGAAPEVIETEAVDVVENAVMGIPGVEEVTSSCRNGAASVSIKFELDKDIDVAMQEVQNKIAQNTHRLPKNLESPTISKMNPEDQPIVWVAVQSTQLNRRQLMTYIRDVLLDKFTTVKGVGDIMVSGYISPNLRVWLNSKKLEAYDLTATDVISTISAQHAELPGGYIETAERESDVRTMGEAKTEEEFGQLMINQRGGRPNTIPIRLNQVARIEEDLADIRAISRFNGETAVGLGIRKQRGENAVEVSKAIRARMNEVKKFLPDGVNMAVSFDSTKFIDASIGAMKKDLVFAAILTGIVCWFFLGSLSSTFNILLAIPTSIVGAFTVIYFAGFTLNTFTLLALTLSIGIVVDDAIMMLENIVRHKEMGKSRIRAAYDGAREISSAATITTIAIVAIFIPVVFMQGPVGRFFFQFGIAISVAVLLSLLEALTITPMRCSQFLDTGKRSSRVGRSIEQGLKNLEKRYLRLLRYLLNYRWTVVLGSIVFFALSLSINKFLRKEFVPAQDQSRFLIRVQAPPGSSLAYTNARLREIEALLKADPIFLRYYTAIGSGLGSGDVNSGIAFITMKAKGDRPLNPATGRQFTQKEKIAELRKKLDELKGVRATFMDLSMRGFSSGRGFPIEFAITGPDWKKLQELSLQIMDAMNASSLMNDVDTDFKLGKSEVQVIPDRDRASSRAVNTAAIGQTVNALVGGVIAGRYTKGSQRNDIRVRLEPDERTQAEQIKNLYVRNVYGEPVKLSDVVRIKEEPSPQLVTRKNRSRAITIYANLKPGASQQAAFQFVEKTAKKILPLGYQIESGGSSEGMKKSFRDLGIALVLGIAVAYMVLASQFNSFLHPVTVLMALPFSISGAFIALYIFGQSLNMYSFIGLLLLMGIVKKNSILLVEFTNQTREKNPDKPVDQALLEACPVRLRPILMTSFATICGAVPGAVARGDGAETTLPMSLTVIGGVLASTILTLIVVPCFYSLMSRIERTKDRAELKALSALKT